MSASLKHDIDCLKATTHYLQVQRENAASSDNETAIRAAQSRADSVLGLWGTSASAPVPGELPGEYRRRLLQEVKARSDKYKDTPLSALSADALEIAEERVYHDARASVFNPDTVPPGQLRQVKERDEMGRLVTRWVGSAPHWMNAFTSTGAHGRINTKLAGIE